MKQKTIVFIGAGNMAKSLIGGLIADGFDPQKIRAAQPHAEELSLLEQQFGVNISTDNNKAAQYADVLVFSVKPYVVKSICEELKSTIHQQHPLVLSIAAGISTQHLQQWLGHDIALIRCMPNTPALVETGATALFANAITSARQKDLAESLMRAVGLTIWLEQESHMDIVTALSGSGLAYFFMVMEALEQSAVQLGLPKQAAHLLTLQTALGAAHMAMESSEEIAVLREHVTSPGGTTEHALKQLTEGGLSELMAKALKAAHQRSIELAKTIS